MFIGGDITIGGNVVTGQILLSNVENNTLILNANVFLPGIDSGICIERFQNENDICFGDVVNDIPNDAGTIIAALSENVILKASSSAVDSFDSNWLKSKKKYFESVQEVSMPSDLLEKYSLGYEITFDDLDLPENQKVTASGMSRGKGFQGVIKRWGFSGGPKSHGSRFHRRPGSIGNMCSQGKVIKGKKLPGHTGHVKITVAGLKLIRVDKGNSCLFVHGAVPGSKNTLIRICKQG